MWSMKKKGQGGGPCHPPVSDFLTCTWQCKSQTSCSNSILVELNGYRGPLEFGAFILQAHHRYHALDVTVSEI